MTLEKRLDSILNSRSKIAIIRLFVSKTADFKATGREIAHRIRFSAPAAHAALKELHAQGILNLVVIGKQHIYSLDHGNRVVLEMLKPMFKKEISLKDEVKGFLLAQIKETRVANEIVSMILYGSLQRSRTNDQSDVDVAVVIKDKKDKAAVENIFLHTISTKFYDYFRARLDVYLKTKEEFSAKRRKNLSPVATLMKSYAVIYGKEPFDI